MGIEFNSGSYVKDSTKFSNENNASNLFKEKVVSEINETADEAYNKMLEKKAEYEASKGIFNQLSEKKSIAYKKYKSAQLNNKESNYSSMLSDSKSSYESLSSQCFNASIDTDVLLWSLKNSISYSGKMNNSASIANSILS